MFQQRKTCSRTAVGRRPRYLRCRQWSAYFIQKHQSVAWPQAHS
ncbi:MULTISPECIES: hypothetical protein [Moorena]|nr:MULTISPECIES: hypothetical protein [Moorena]